MTQFNLVGYLQGKIKIQILLVQAYKIWGFLEVDWVSLFFNHCESISFGFGIWIWFGTRNCLYIFFFFLFLLNLGKLILKSKRTQSRCLVSKAAVSLMCGTFPFPLIWFGWNSGIVFFLHSLMYSISQGTYFHYVSTYRPTSVVWSWCLCESWSLVDYPATVWACKHDGYRLLCHRYPILSAAEENIR